MLLCLFICSEHYCNDKARKSKDGGEHVDTDGKIWSNRIQGECTLYYTKIIVKLHVFLSNLCFMSN